MNLIRIMPAEGAHKHGILKPSSTRKEVFLRAVIFANGNIDHPENIPTDLRDDDLVIAADGGAEHCKALGIQPDVIIGDMDSISEELLEEFKDADIQLILYPPDKDRTDLELALDYANKKDLDNVVLFGVLGGRLDLLLANLMLLSRDDWKTMSLTIIDEPETAYILRNHDSLTIFGNPGDIISLVPLSDHVSQVSTQGLRWKLHDATLVRGTTLSVSNELENTSARIEIGEGKLILVHRKVLPGRGKE
jgi:thiamine pyrophosphokinase